MTRSPTSLALDSGCCMRVRVTSEHMQKVGTVCLYSLPVQCVVACFLEFKNMFNPNPDSDVGYWGGHVAITLLCILFVLIFGVAALWQYRRYRHREHYDVQRARIAMLIYAVEAPLALLCLALLWRLA